MTDILFSENTVPQRLKDAGDQTFVKTIYDLSFTTQTPIQAFASATTTASTLATLGITVPSWATLAFLIPQSGAIYYRTDGTAPTTAAGMPIAQGQAWPIPTNAGLLALQLIAASTTTFAIEFRG